MKEKMLPRYCMISVCILINITSSLARQIIPGLSPSLSPSLNLPFLFPSSLLSDSFHFCSPLFFCLSQGHTFNSIGTASTVPQVLYQMNCANSHQSYAWLTHFCSSSQHLMWLNCAFFITTVTLSHRIQHFYLIKWFTGWAPMFTTIVPLMTTKLTFGCCIT